MSANIIVHRYINKKFKLIKNTKEIYKHSGLNIFPNNFNFQKPCLLLSRDILKNYSTILLFKKYNFILCECETKFFDEKIKKSFKKMNEDILFLNENFFSEISESNLNSVFDFLKDKFNILKILNLENFLDFVKSDLEMYDLIFANYKNYENELISINNCENIKEEENIYFEDYYENLDVLHRNGKISKGTLVISQVNNDYGEVVEKDKRIKVYGSEINRALHGDEVYIENNKIVGIYKRKKTTIVGTIIKLEVFNNFWNVGLVKPIDNRLPEIKIFTIKNMDYLMRKVEVNILDWDKNSLYPRGVIYNVLGSTGKYEDEILAILHHCSVDYANLKWDDLLEKEKIVKEEFNLEKAMDEIALGERTDLRHLQIYSIDPHGCTDIDDALHCIVLDDCYEVGVHIADVSYYVKPNTFLDAESKNRSTTIYFPDRRIDMLPPFLSSNLASLLENKDKATVSVIWKISKDFKILETKICKSLINIKKNMTYEEAEELLEIYPFRDLLEIATFYRKERYKNGALNLNAGELYFDKNKKIARKTPLRSHYLVEEFMLKANVSVAEFLIKNNPEYSLLRKHPLPTAIELDSIDFTNSKTINESLSKIDPKKQQILKRVITRSMQQAVYFSSGETSDYYHFGLAINSYTHFTSPIRRYPDLIVHRTVSYILKNEFDLVDKMDANVDKKACSKMNFRHRNAQLASRMVNDLCLAQILENVNEELSAVVIAIKDNGIVIFNSDYGIESFVITNEKYKLFQNIKIIVESSFKDFCVDRIFKIKIL